MIVTVSPSQIVIVKVYEFPEVETPPPFSTELFPSYPVHPQGVEPVTGGKIVACKFKSAVGVNVKS